VVAYDALLSALAISFSLCTQQLCTVTLSQHEFDDWQAHWHRIGKTFVPLVNKSLIVSGGLK